jgi:hypothetical protein
MPEELSLPETVLSFDSFLKHVRTVMNLPFKGKTC